MSTKTLAYAALAMLILVAGLAGQASRSESVLSERELTNVTALARLQGYVRYFHPSDGVDRTESGRAWNRFSVEGVLRVLPCRNHFELARALEDHCARIAPTVRVFVKGQGGALPRELQPPERYWSLGIIYRDHLGYAPGRRRGHLVERRMVHHFTQRRIRIPGTVPDPGKPLHLELPGGIEARVPDGLFADKERTLPVQASLPAAPGPPLPAGFERDARRRATRLAAAAEVWNAVQHFHPWLDRESGSWSRSLPKWLREAAACATPLALRDLLRSMLVPLNDGAVAVLHPATRARNLPGIGWRMCGERLVITDVSDPLAGQVSIGDEVISMDGQPALQAVARRERLVSASTPGHRRWVALLELILGPPDRDLVLELARSDGTRQEVALARGRRADRASVTRLRMQGRRPDPYSDLGGGILYVDLTRLDDASLDAHVSDLRKCRGVVLDLRGTSRLSDYLIGLLTEKALRTPLMQTPRVSLPDMREAEWLSRDWEIQPADVQIARPRVLLIDASTQGTAEMHAWMVRANGLARVIGETTAGALGLSGRGVFPGGFQVEFSAQRVKRRDGTFFHGNGVQPDEVVGQSRASLRKGRDALLERARAILAH